MTDLAALIIQQAAAQPTIESLQLIAAWLPGAMMHRLDQADLARIDSYAGGGRELHELINAVLPLQQSVWYETEVVAQHGTRMILGYGGTPAPDGVNIWHATYAAEHGRIIGPLGPLRMHAGGMEDAPDNESTRMLRSSAGIVARALLLGIGTRR